MAKKKSAGPPPPPPAAAMLAKKKSAGPPPPSSSSYAGKEKIGWAAATFRSSRWLRKNRLDHHRACTINKTNFKGTTAAKSTAGKASLQKIVQRPSHVQTLVKKSKSATTMSRRRSLKLQPDKSKPKVSGVPKSGTVKKASPPPIPPANTNAKRASIIKTNSAGQKHRHHQFLQQTLMRSGHLL